MASVLDKFMGLLGVRDVVEEQEEEEVYEEEEEVEDYIPLSRAKKSQPERDNTGKRGNLVSLAGGQRTQAKMIIVEPSEFEEVRAFVDHLKQKRSMIIRLDRLPREEAQRIVDFMSGATHALDGNMRKLGENIFCFAPASVVIEGELEPEEFDARIER